MTTYAAVDIGTNSVRLLVVDDRRGTLERLLRITRLGQGVNETGRLTAEAIERTVGALREYKVVMDRHRVSRARMTATSAARDASNRNEFFAAASDAVGIEPELLSGEEEAHLSFAGATAELDPRNGPYLVVDIGGGSTEFALGSGTCEAARSFDIGCVRLTEQYLHHDPPLPEELTACLSLTETYLEDLTRSIPAVSDARQFVGLAGTVTTVAAVEIGLETYDAEALHHFRLSRSAAEDVFRTLATEAIEDRKHNPGLGPGRVDVIVGGSCILQSIMRYFGFDDCLVSEADILDGLIAGLIDVA